MARENSTVETNQAITQEGNNPESPARQVRPALFISYSRKDSEAARRLAGAFSAQDFDCWIDWEDIQPTVDWRKDIQKGIEEADSFIFLISPDSAQSKVCKEELDHAVLNGKRLIPIVVRDIRSAEAPPELRPLNWIYLRENDDFEASFGKLVKAVHTDYAWVQVHRQLQLKALEWERSGHKNDFLLHGEELRDAELQLAANSSKEPYPTGLQQDYVLQSRKASVRQRRVVRSVTVAVMIALSVLAMAALLQARAARTAEATALANEAIARTAESDAVNKENARATAQAQAEERATIALSRQLAAQAKADYGTGNPSKQETAILLAARSMQLFPVLDSALLLQNNIFAYPTIQVSHDDSVYSAAFSPDGRLVASGSADGVLRLWEADTGKEISRMTHDSDVYSVTFSPDGEYIASSSRDSTARIWDVATGQEVSRLTHLDEVYYAVFSPDGSHVATRGFNSARVWDLSTGDEVFQLPDEAVGLIAFSPECVSPPEASAEGCGRSVLSISQGILYSWDLATGTEVSRLPFGDTLVPLAFSPDGKYIAAEGQSAISILEVSTEREVARIDRSVSFVAFSPDGRYLVSGGFSDRSVRVWEVLTGKEVALIVFEDGIVLTSAGMSPDSVHLVSTDEDGNTRLWEIPTRVEVANLAHDNIVMSLSFTRDGKYLLSGSEDGVAKLWELSTENELARLEYNGSRHSLAISPDGSHVVSVDGNNIVHVWNISADKEAARTTHEGFVHQVAISPDGRYAVSASEDHTVRVLEIATGEEIARMTHDGAVTAIAISTDGKLLGSVSDDNTVRVWELLSGKEVARITVETGVYLVALSPECISTPEASAEGCGMRVASASGDNAVHIWEVATGKELVRMVHGAPLKSIAFSPGGDHLVSAGECAQSNSADICLGATARVWETSTGREVALMTHDVDVYPAAFSPDGQYVFSASWDGTLRLWEALTGKEVARMTHDSEVYSAAFSPDGKYVASGTGDNTVHVWIWQPGDLIQDACSRVSRNLTIDEWDRYMGEGQAYQLICPDLPPRPEGT